VKKTLVLLVLSLCVHLGFAQQFQHVVIVVQENRTPDNLFGSNPNFEPGVDIATSGLSNGKVITLTPFALNSCWDLPHGHRTFVAQYNKGAMDGFNVKASKKNGCVPPSYPAYHYVDNSTGEIQPYFDIAKSGGFANRFFQTNQGPSFPAHQFLVSGTSSLTDSSTVLAEENPFQGSRATGCTAPPGSWVYTIDANGNQGKAYPCFSRSSIFNLLDAAGLSWKYYSPNAQVTWDAPMSLADYYQTPNNILKPPQVLTDISNCQLANVVWVTPSSYYSDHPGGHSTGPKWVSSIVNTVLTNPACPSGEVYWKDTAILITYDDWGGFYDHVPPPPSTSSCTGVYCNGFRVPLLVVSPYTPAGYVSNTVLDFGSILRFVEENYHLPCIATGEWADCTSNGLSDFFKGPLVHKSAIRAKPFVDDGDDTADPDTD
jgi:phospholipase C